MRGIKYVITEHSTPDIKYLRNTLESQFGIPPEYVDEFYTLYEPGLKEND